MSLHRNLVTQVNTVAVIGTGTIGASWTAHFLAQGLRVRAWDPAPNAQSMLRRFIDTAWPQLERLGLRPGATREALSWCASPEETLHEASFVQESAPERLAVKRELYARIDAAIGGEVVLCSSTSGLMMSDLQAGCRAAPRFAVGHPFNPPHLIPLVEVVGGKETDAETVDWAISFYNHWGKKAIRLNKEVPGHLVNRIQVALWREAMDAVLSGLASVDDVDTAIAFGPGLRWGVMGPFRLCALAGGDGGYPHFLEHFAAEIESWWRDMRDVELNADVRERLSQAVATALEGRDMPSIASERDALLLAMMETLARVRKEQLGHD